MKVKIKCLCILFLMNMLKVFWLLPVNKKRVMYMSFGGEQFSDNPKYIYQCIAQNRPDMENVWVLDDVQKANLLPAGTKVVKAGSMQFIRMFLTAQTVITNNFISSYLPVRKSQIVLNTWHGGSPLKTVGLVGDKSTEYDRFFFHLHARKYSAYLSSSQFMTEEVFYKSFDYQGTVLEYGMPRNAILFGCHEDIKRKVYEHFNIPNIQNSAIVLYAPTFRGTAKKGQFLRQEQMLDVMECVNALENRFGKKFYFLFRAHHAMRMGLSSSQCLLASDYPDMQELLYASDVLITDYSSCMGDMALMKKPTFLYVPDLEEYIQDRGFYWDIHSLPFPLAQTNQALRSQIESFDEIKYGMGVDAYHSALGSFESAHSVEKTVRWLEDQWSKRQ